MAIKEKEGAVARLAAVMQKSSEGENNSNGFLHAVRRTSELRGLPAAALRAIDWQLRRDLMEVEKVRYLVSFVVKLLAVFLLELKNMFITIQYY